MKILAPSKYRFVPVACSILFFAACAIGSLGTASAYAAGVSAPARIAAEVNNQLTQIPGSRLPKAQAQYETGRVDGATKLQGVTIYFGRTAGQEADLQKLMAAQQDPGSPLFHKWLTPEQFGSRFGLADADLAKVQTWLQQQGFSVDSVARGKNWIRFSGSVSQIESAFATEIHTYKIQGEKHFAPSTALSVPSALAQVVVGIRNLDDFRPKPMMKMHSSRAISGKANPLFTSGEGDGNYVAPGDINVIYDVNPLHTAGTTGTGQTIAIMGQSSVDVTDIENFQNAAGLAVKDPTLLLVPGSGNDQVSAGDEGESDLDLEWSGAVAPGAQILFVYTGDSSNNGVFDSLAYAVNEQVAQIISFSYGVCEFDIGSTNVASVETVLSQAATQGQSVLAASGDSGSTECSDPSSTDSTADQEQLNPSYPASSAYVTAVGGTEFNEGSNTSTYWSSNGSSDVITSALSYIPEMVWNDGDTSHGLAASGGGPSTFFAKPSWQTGVSGIPSDGKRDTPDVSLDASNEHDPYLLCSSDKADWQSGQVGSCTSGFRDADNKLTAAGGTSFATPIFGGMLALINEKQNYTTGQGLANPTLYKLASNAGTYSTAFHDITTGNNDCSAAGSKYCAGAGKTDYAAGTGYDLATGLGSVDLNVLAGVWSANTATVLVDTATVVAASNTAPAVNASVSFTITVTSATGSTVPTGSVSITVDSGTATTSTLTANGTVVFTTSFSTGGVHQIIAQYTGDATHGPSINTVVVTVPVTSSGTGTFGLGASNLSIAQGSSGTSTITVTPKTGYTGTVLLNFDTSNDDALANLCYSFTDTTSSGDGVVIISSANTAVTTQLTLDTNATDCSSSAAIRKSGKQAFRNQHRLAAQAKPDGSGGALKSAAAGIAFAGLLLAGLIGRKSRKYASQLRGLACLIVLAAMGLFVSACGGGGSSSNGDPSKGSYTITVTGQDSATATITGTTTFTFVIH